jgi:hypothetical protein
MCAGLFSNSWKNPMVNHRSVHRPDDLPFAVSVPPVLQTRQPKGTEMKLLPVLKTAIAIAITFAGLRAAAGEFYEIKTYTLKTAKQPVLDDYLGKAYIPALTKLGIGPVGVFTEKGSNDTVFVYVLTVLSSPAQIAELPARLAADADYKKAAADYLEAKAADPVYDRIESSVSAAIEGMANIAKTDTSKPRIVNLRIYESHNERAHAKKVEMFNTAELAIFKKDGLTPLLFGSTIAGAKMPNLTYALIFADDDERKAAWKKFGGDPDWHALKSKPEYADKEIVSHITNKILTPTSYSGI